MRSADEHCLPVTTCYRCSYDPLLVRHSCVLTSSTHHLACSRCRATILFCFSRIFSCSQFPSLTFAIHYHGLVSPTWHPRPPTTLFRSIWTHVVPHLPWLDDIPSPLVFHCIFICIRLSGSTFTSEWCYWFLFLTKLTQRKNNE